MKITIVSEQGQETAPPIHKPVFKSRQIIPDALIEELEVRCFVSKVFQSTTQAEAIKREIEKVINISE